MAKEKKVNGSSFIKLMVFTLGSRILGLLREIIRANYLGDGAVNDTFNFAFMIPNLLRRLFAEASMTVAFIPTFKGFLKKDNKEETENFLNSIFTALTLIVTAAVTLGIIITPIIAKLIDKTGSHTNEIIVLTRIMFPYIIFISIAALLQGILNSLNIFGPGGFVPILFNIITISFTIIFANKFETPARAMALGIVAGGFLQMAFQLPYVIKNGYRFKLNSIPKAFKNKGTRNVGRLIVPTLASMGAYQLNSAVATSIAYRTGVGVSSALSYSLRLQELVLGIFAVSIGTVLISTLSKAAKDKDWETYNSNLKSSINAIALITIPITIFAFIHSTEIVELIFKMGNFGERGVAMTSSVFRIHISGLYFIALTRILAPAFFSIEDSKTPAKLGVFSVFIGIILMFILAPIYKANGIAVATIISSIILAISYFILLKRVSIVEFSTLLQSTLPGAIRILIYSIISAIPLYFLKDSIFGLVDFDNKILKLGVPLVITTLLYFTLYVLFILIFKEKSVTELKRLARK